MREVRSALQRGSSQFQFADQAGDLSGNSCRKLHWRVVFSTI